MQHVGQPGGIRAVVGVGVRGHLAHPVQVAAGAERLAGARQQQHAHARILGGVGDGAGQRGDQGLVERVAHIGTVQRQADDGAVVGDVQRGVQSHGGLLLY
ncbi:hypothetical protein D3C72_1993580 [compost metagenome]